MVDKRAAEKLVMRTRKAKIVSALSITSLQIGKIVVELDKDDSRKEAIVKVLKSEAERLNNLAIAASMCL